MIGTMRFIALSLIMVLLAAVPVFSEERSSINPDIEESVRRGLDYLVRSQNENGSWGGSYGRVPGVAGLCALAFMAHGEEPSDRPAPTPISLRVFSPSRVDGISSVEPDDLSPTNQSARPGARGPRSFRSTSPFGVRRNQS